MRSILIVLALIATSACAPVRPWERAALSHPGMAWERQTERESGRRHVIGVREGAQGSAAKAGGGCGCD